MPESASRGGLLWGVCVYSRGVSAPGRVGGLLWGDVCSWGGGVCSGGVASQYALRQTPNPCEQNDKQV